MDLLQELSQALINGNAPKTKELTQKAVAEGLAPEKILNEGLIAGMDVVGGSSRTTSSTCPRC